MSALGIVVGAGLLLAASALSDRGQLSAGGLRHSPH
jgi:hypothetical protein